MNDLKNIEYKSNSGLKIIITIFAIILSTLLFVMALYNVPVSDDLPEFSMIRDKGIIYFVTSGWNYAVGGRFLQMLSNGMMWKLFGNNVFVLQPLFYFILLGLGFGFIYFLLVKPKVSKVLNSLVFGFLLASSSLYFMTCLFDSWLWKNNTPMYVGSIVGFIWIPAIALLILTRKVYLYQKILLGILVTLLTTANETFALVIFVLGGLVILEQVIARGKTIQKLMWVFVPVMCGLLLLYFSPAAQLRHANNMKLSSLGIKDIFLQGPLNYYATMFSSFHSWQILMAIFVGVTLGIVFFEVISAKQFLVYSSAALVIFFSSTYLSFVVSVYGNENYTFVVMRTLTLPNFGLFLGVVVFSGSTVCFLKRKYSAVSLIISIVSIVLLLAIAEPLLTYSQGYLTGLSNRKTQFTLRELNIAAQEKTNNNNTITVRPVPSPFENSQAVEFMIRGWADSPHDISWYAEAFKQYYHIQNYKLIVLIPVDYAGPRINPNQTYG